MRVQRKGLEKEYRFDGSKQKYSKFVKLMGKAFKTYRMMEILQVPTKWQAVSPKNPTKEGMVNLFESDTVTKEQVNAQADKVCSDASYGTATPEYFKIFDLPPPNKQRRVRTSKESHKIEARNGQSQYMGQTHL